MRAVVTASTAMTKTVRRRLQKANGTCASLDTPIFAPRAITAKIKAGVAQSILSAMVCWDAGFWNPPSQASMQQLSSFQAKVARRAINDRRQAGGTTDAQISEMFDLPGIPGVLRMLPPPTVGCSGCELPTAAQSLSAGG